MSNETPESKGTPKTSSEVTAGADTPADGSKDGHAASEVKKVATGSSDSPKPVPTDYDPATDALKRIRAEMGGILEGAAAMVDSGELPLIGWGLSLPRVQKLADDHAGKPWFFVGDIHGDFLAWHRLFERVRQEKDFRLCFLGDLVDRGPFHLECFAALLKAAKTYPYKILWILGNHDDGLRFNLKEDRELSSSVDPSRYVVYSKVEKEFSSSVVPSEFADYLNTAHDGISPQQLEAWGKLFISICRRLPRAVLFPDGLLATHGGVPFRDRWPTLKTLEAFYDERALGDFTWVRLIDWPNKNHIRYDVEKRKTSSAFDMGYKDLEEFCNKAAEIGEGFTVKRIVRGHDHVENGFEAPANYKNIPLLTMNGFGFDYISNSVASYREKLALGVGVSGQLPRVEEVAYLSEEHSGVYPRRENSDAG
jgi:Calcineurin-like phosphoesterase